MNSKEQEVHPVHVLANAIRNNRSRCNNSDKKCIFSAKMTSKKKISRQDF